MNVCAKSCLRLPMCSLHFGNQSSAYSVPKISRDRLQLTREPRKDMWYCVAGVPHLF